MLIGAISAVSAADLNATDDMIADSANKDLISIDLENDESLNVNEDNSSIVLGSTTYMPTDFDDIQKRIDAANDGDIIVLNGHYEMESSDTIIVNKTLNFRGMNDATINGSSDKRLVTVGANGVTFTGITFKNGYSDYGGAINSGTYNFSVDNCKFIDNVVSKGGGALYGGSAMNCSFIGNSAGSDGGAVYSGYVANSLFENNSARFGGAMYLSNAVNCSFVGNSAEYGGCMGGGSAMYCSFVGNSAGDGGALYQCNPINCIFMSNSASDDGGAVYFYNGDSVVNCSFVNNSASRGGAMRGGSVVNCSFVGNSASDGGALYECIVLNCDFIGNSAKNGGAVYDGYVANSLFENNSATANGGAINGIRVSNCTFSNNHANEYGGAVYNANVSSNSIFKNNTANIGNDYYETTVFILDKTFTDLNMLISNNDSEIYLNNNYTFELVFDSEFIEGIPINHKVTIYGNGHTIDGINKARIFTVRANVVFKDIIFINAKSSGNGGAVYCSAINCGSVVNCSFVGNSASRGGALYGGSAVNCSFVGNSAGNGAAVYFYNGDSVVNCSFVGNSAGQYGGALSGDAMIYCNAVNCSFVGNSASRGGAMCAGSAMNCSFVNNSAGDSGGVLYNVWGLVSDCSFVNNSAGCDGGALYESSVVNCSFVGNSAGRDGGAMSGGSAVDCSFVGNSAQFGGAMRGGSAVNCSFNNNSASGDGGAMFEGNVLNSIFRGNSAQSGGAVYNVYAIDSSFENNRASVNGGAMSGKKAIHCKFSNNRANEYGGAVYNAKVSLNSTINNNFAPTGSDTYNVSFFSDESSFTELYSLISNPDFTEFYLDSNYAYDFTSDSNFTEGILINRNITIYGNGHTIDGSSQARIFSVTAKNAVFKDIIFTNAMAKNGGALYGGSAVNCSFIGNSADQCGGAMKDSYAVNCSFVGNSARDRGGALFGGSAVNCSFIGNSANHFVGGALYGGSAVNCSFVGNHADTYGGAVSEGSAIDCSFVGNSASDGGAMKDSYAVNCSFVGNSANYGGALYGGSAVNCSFVNNSAVWCGGALYGGSAVNCSFENNSDRYWYAIDNSNNIWDCIFDIYPTNVNCYYTSYINAEDLSIGKGEDGFLIVKLYDMRGPLSGKCVNYTIGGYDASNITDSEGFAYLNVANYLTESGFHDVNVTFHGDGVSSSSSKISKVFIKYDPEFAFENISITNGDDATLSVLLSNFNGPITGEYIVFIINGQSPLKRTNNNGLANLNVNDYLIDIGEYTVGIVYSGNDFTNPGSANATVRINYYIGNLTANVEGKYYNDTTLTFKLLNSKNNNPISDASINVTFSNGEKVTLITDSNGIASYDVPFNPGTYDLTAKVIDENIDVNDVVLNNLLINEIEGIIELTQNGTGYNNSNLIVRTYNNMNNDAYRKIKVYLNFDNGKSYEIITDDDGIAVFHIPFDIGTYSVNTYVTGNHMSFNSPDLNILIEKSDSIVNGNDIEFAFGESGSTTLELIGCKDLDSYSVAGHSEAQITWNGSKITVSGLNAGKYNLTIVTVPDSNHNPITKNIGITVNNAASNVVGNDIVFDYGSSGTTALTLTGCSINENNITVIGHSEAEISLSGNTIKISNLSAGNYTLQVVTTPNTNYESITKNIGVTVNKIDSDVSGNDIVFDYGGSGSTTLTLTGCSVSEGDISVVGCDDASVKLDGLKVTVSNLDVGTYTLQVKTTPDVNHNSVTKNIGITVNRIDSSVTGSDVVFDYGDSGSTALTLTGCNVTVNDISVAGHSEAEISLNGNVVTVSNLNVGTYALQVKTSPDNNHKSITKTIGITVNNVDSSVSGKDIAFDYGSSGSTNLTLDGCSVNINDISVVGHSEAEISLSGNTVIVSNLSVGTYTLQVKTTPDNNHNSVTKNIGITVNKADSSVSFSKSIIFDYGSSDYTILTLNGCTVSVNDIGVVGFDGAGIKLEGSKVTVSNLDAGTYTLQVKTTPDNNHNSVTRTIGVTVNKVDADITFQNTISFSEGSSGSTIVSVVGGTIDVSHMSVVGQSEAVINYIDDKIIVSGLKEGTYTLAVSVVPDSNHNSVTKGIGISVTDSGSGSGSGSGGSKTESKVDFSTSNLVFDYGSSDYTTLVLVGCSVTQENVYIKGYPEAAKLEGTRITVSGLNPGNYVLYVVTTPDDAHFSVTATLPVTVNKVASSISFDKDKLTFDYGGSGSLGVNVSGGDLSKGNIYVLNHEEANIALNGNVVIVSGLNAGSYTLSVTSVPDDNHTASTKTIPITVNKVDSSIAFDKDMISVGYGDSGSIGVNVDGGSISYNGIAVLDHTEAKISWENNVVSVSNLNVGNYTLKVTTTPDSNHNAISKTVNVIVSKVDSSISFSNELSFDYGGSAMTTLSVVGASVSKDNINVLNHPEAEITFNDNAIIVSGLDVGSYTLQVTTVPDSNHNAVTKNINVNVNKVDSSLTFSNPVSFEYGGSGLTTLTVIGANVIKEGIRVLNHGEANITLDGDVVTVSGLDVGSYTLQVTTTPDSNHNSVTKTVMVNVNRADSTLNFDSNMITFDYGGEGSIGVNVTGGIISDGSIRVLNYKDAKIKVKDNVIYVSNLNASSYTLQVETIPDSNHYSVTKTITVNVNRVDSNITFNGKVITFNYGDSGSIGVSVDGGSISINGVSVVGYDAKPTFKDNKITVSGLNVGNYTLKVTTTPDSNHNSVSASIGVVVNKTMSKIKYGNEIVFDYLGVGTTTLTLDGCTVSKDNLEIVGYPNVRPEISSANVVSISGLSAGKYTLKVTTAPDGNHIENSINIPITVNKINSKIGFTKDSISFKYAKSGSVPIVLENCKVASMRIVGYDNIKPALKGNEITVSGLAVGNYVLRVTTEPENGNYESVSADIDVIVTKNTASITVQKSQTVAYKKSTQWSITLKDSDGKALSGITPVLKIYKGNKLYKTVSNLKATDSNGVTNYQTSGLPVGTYKFVVSVSHAGYNVNSVSTPVKVIKQTPVKIIVNTKTTKKGGTITVIVKDKTGKKYLNNVKVTLKIKNGKTYKTVTLITGKFANGKGACAYSTNMLTVGSHKVTVTPTDIKYSGSGSKTLKIKASAKKYRAWWEKVSKGTKTSSGIK